MLEVKNLSVAVDGRTVVREVSCCLTQGEVAGLVGVNGAGKSSLLAALGGHESYAVTSGAILLNGEDITHATPYERAIKGLGVVHQQPPKLAGVKLGRLLAHINPKLSEKARDTIIDRLQIRHLLERDTNSGFSGGELRRTELAQVMLQNPSVVLIDEIDTGVDVDSAKIINRALAEFLEEKTALVISHHFELYEHISPKKLFVLRAGTMTEQSNVSEALHIIKNKGFEGLVK